MYLFTKKIKCLGCEGNYKGITERGKRKYVCSNYTNYRNCKRFVIEQSELIQLAYKHIEIQMLKRGQGLPRSKNNKEEDITDKLVEYVKQINVSPENEEIEILYMDSSVTKITKSRIVY